MDVRGVLSGAVAVFFASPADDLIVVGVLNQFMPIWAALAVCAATTVGVVAGNIWRHRNRLYSLVERIRSDD